MKMHQRDRRLGALFSGLKQGNGVIYLWLRDPFGYCERMDVRTEETRRHRGRPSHIQDLG